MPCGWSWVTERIFPKFSLRSKSAFCSSSTSQVFIYIYVWTFLSEVFCTLKTWKYKFWEMPQTQILFNQTHLIHSRVDPKYMFKYMCQLFVIQKFSIVDNTVHDGLRIFVYNYSHYFLCHDLSLVSMTPLPLILPIDQPLLPEMLWSGAAASPNYLACGCPRPLMGWSVAVYRAGAKCLWFPAPN